MNNHGELSFEQIVSYLKATGQEENELFQRAAAIKQHMLATMSTCGD